MQTVISTTFYFNHDEKRMDLVSVTEMLPHVSHLYVYSDVTCLTNHKAFI